MRLGTLLNTARNGELKGLSQKDKTNDVIIDFINLGLIAIYGRFTLNMREATVTITPNKSLYSLNRSSTDVTSGIVKMNLQNKEEISRVIGIKDDLGNTLSINNSNDPYTITQHTYDTITTNTLYDQVTKLTIMYCSMPTEIPLDADDDYIINLPRFLIEPLMHYVGYRANASVDGTANAENSVHYLRFKQSCDDVEARGLIPGDNTTRSVMLKGFDRGVKRWQFPM